MARGTGKNGKRIPALQRLLQEGYFANKEEALPYLMSGAVHCGGQPVHTAGQLVEALLPLSVQGLGDKYVGKGGYKLEGAIRAFGVQAAGRVCIDAGACTGGFTDCLVQQGAALVYAVEVGYGQLAGSLAQHPAVRNLEKTNIGDPALLSLQPVPTLGSVDLSYLSLMKAVPQFQAIMGGQGELLCLVKPLFETEDLEARRSGHMDTATYEPLLLRLKAALNQLPNTGVYGVTHSPVTGNGGTHEFFFHVCFGREKGPPGLDKDIRLAVEQALALPKYQK